VPGKRAKNARDYWKQIHGHLEQRNQPGKKRKGDSGTEDHGRRKKCRAENTLATPHVVRSQDMLPAADDADGAGSPLASVELNTVSMQRASLDEMDEEGQMQLLKKDVNLDDPQARQDLCHLYNAVLSFGRGKCKLADGKWDLDGFGTSLFHHQVIGVSWMLSRELHPTEPKGGILADEMGMGKTVQLLACISQNLPGKSSKALKTLIIAPKRLLCQWYTEIKRHCSNKKMKRVLIYAASRGMMNSEWEEANIM
jgi:hypothetical protein